MEVYNDRLLALAYLQSPPDAFWRWAEQGRVLAWKDGATIAFREEIVCILAELAPLGLPPFGAVVLLLAASREKLPERPLLEDWLRQEFQRTDGHGMPSDALFRHLKYEYATALDRLSRLPRNLIATPRAKAVLAATVFEEAVPERQAAEAHRIVEALRGGFFSDEELDPGEGRSMRSSQARDVRLVYEGLNRVNAEQLALRIQTGLDDLVEAAEVNLTPAQRVRRLLGQLRGDADHAGLARLARDIMAAIYLPRSLSELDELALGGISDITNRGALDRLLLSELAHDDLTLAVRIALNEALYMRREPPAHHPPLRLALLLDAGIRLWGVPRLFATAVALAFLAKDEHRTTVATYCATGVRAEPMDLCSRRGLIAHLGRLEPAPHPGAALGAFLAELGLVDETELVLITHRDALADRRFREDLDRVQTDRFYIATVDGGGRFELHEHPDRAGRPICQADIHLEKLFRETAPRPPLIIKERDPNLPVILSVRPFPFLLPVNGKVECVRRLGKDGGVCVVNKRQLMTWDGPGVGARMVTALLPPGKTVWLHVGPEKRVHVLKAWQPDNVMPLATVDLESGRCELRELVPEEEPLGFHHQAGNLFVILPKQVKVVALSTGQLVQTIQTDGRWIHGPFFRRAGRGWDHLHWDGQVAQLLPFSLPEPLQSEEIEALFSREGQEDVWAVTQRGRLLGSQGDVLHDFGNDFSTLGLLVSEDGHRLLTRPAEGHFATFLDLQAHQRRVGGRVPMVRLFHAVPHGVKLPVRNVRRRFTHIAANGGEWLMLRTPRGTWLRIPDLFHKPVNESETIPLRAVPFTPVPLSNDLGCSLQVAPLADGGHAYLDSRGLLHLKSGDPRQPELSIVLGDRESAIWASDGSLWGPKFFVGDQPTRPELELWEKFQELRVETCGS